MSTGFDDDFEIAPEDQLEGGAWEAIPEGTYHLAVTSVDVNHISKKQHTPGIEITCQVQSGTVAGQEGKTIKAAFWLPSKSQNDKGDFCCRRLSRLAYVLKVGAAGVKLGATPWEQMAARHFIAKIKHGVSKGNNGRDFINMDIPDLEFWHVASPLVAGIPMDKECLELMPMGDNPFPKEGVNGDGAAPAGTPPAANAYADL